VIYIKFFSLISVLLFSGTILATPIETDFKLGVSQLENNAIPTGQGEIFFDKGIIKIRKSGSETVLHSDIKDSSSSGVEAVSIELWNTNSYGLMFFIQVREWYQGGSHWGEERFLKVIQYTPRSKNKVTILGTVPLGDAGKGYAPRIKTYLIQDDQLSSLDRRFKLITIKNNCDYFSNGDTCIDSLRSLDLVSKKMELLKEVSIKNHPSFGCDGKLTSIESFICRNQHLSNLDSILSKLYKLNKTNDSTNRQRAWLRERNDCKSSSALKLCLIQSYNQRISDLII
jgi:uncharacterized protein YecT (DUF1311 family)